MSSQRRGRLEAHAHLGAMDRPSALGARLSRSAFFARLVGCDERGKETTRDGKVDDWHYMY